MSQAIRRAALAASFGLVLACNAIFGFDERPALPPGDLPGGEGGPPGDGGGSDGENGDGESGDGPSVVCAMGLTACGSSCVKLDSDPIHCGRCGRDCQGTSCTTGACASAVVRSGEGKPGTLLLDGAQLTWSETTGSTRLRTCTLPACAAPADVFTMFVSAPFAAGGGRVFWRTIDTGVMAYCSPSSCTRSLFGQPTTAPGGFAADATRAYYSVPTSNLVGACTVNDPCSGVTTVATVTNPTGIAVSGGVVYIVAQEDHAVRKCPVAGCGAGAVDVAQNQQSMSTQIAVGGNSVYWVASSKLRTCPTSGCVGTPIDLAASTFSDLVADATHVFWLTGTQVLACPSTGCPAGPQVLATSSQLQGIAVDDKNVYYTSSADGAIKRVAKP